MNKKQKETAIEVKGITKSYPGVVANKSVDFSVNKGEIHALVGENGAGKSTLMKILYGIEQPDEGKIYVNGELVQINKVPNQLYSINDKDLILKYNSLMINNIKQYYYLKNYLKFILILIKCQKDKKF